MKKALLVVAGFLFVLSAAQVASATSFTTNFCPGDATCPTGITQARLTFTTVDGTADPNDYTLAMTITGNGDPLLNGVFVDSVSFSINGVQTPQGYAALPGVTGPAGATWTPHFDNINGSVAECTTNGAQAQEVCAQSSGNGVAVQNAVLVWNWTLDLVDSVGTLANGTGVNFRVQFVNGTSGANFTILSPGSQPLGGGTNGGGITGGGQSTVVPEPASLLLLGSGLGFVATRLRRKKQ